MDQLNHISIHLISLGLDLVSLLVFLLNRFGSVGS